MMRARRTIMLSIVLAGLGYLAYAYGSRLERETHRSRTPLRGEARRNPVLAAERLLSQFGVDVQSVRSLERLPPVDHVLLLAIEDRILTAERASRLLDWVSRGGYLIVGPHLSGGQATLETHQDPLLAALGVRVMEYEPSELGARAEMEIFVGGSDPVVVSFPEAFGLLTVGQDEEGEGDSEVHDFVEISHGDGQVAALTDLRFAHNDLIGDLDHAGFLLELVGRGGHREGVWLVYAQSRSSVLSLLMSHAWPSLLAAVLLGVAVVARHSVRFGPILPVPVQGQRRLLEHVEAVGRFLWRTNSLSVMLDASRDELLRRAATRRPGIRHQSVSDQARFLAARTGLARGEIEIALQGGARRREYYVSAIRTLQNLGRRL